MDDKNTEIIFTGEKITRKNFLRQTGCAVTGSIIMISVLPDLAIAGPEKQVLEMTPEERAAIQASDGYIIVDPKKCQGCLTCMLACSLVHEGEVNLSLSRIQIIQDSYGKYPDDILISQCRQCIKPSCLEACPSGALHIDRENGNVRLIDGQKCTGCMACVESCPFEASRAIWNHIRNISIKCDLCAVTPHWEEKGGPAGKQACAAVCPVGAIRFTKDIPVQEGDTGYFVNLRGKGWKKLGYPVD